MHLTSILPVLLLFINGPFKASAQSNYATNATEIITTPLQLSTTRTTVIILAAAIAENGVDRGSALIYAKVVDGVSNVVKLRATSDSLAATNMTIFTKDGRVYRFAVTYSAQPGQDFFDFSKLPSLAASDGLRFLKDRISDDAVDKTTAFVTNLPAHRSRPRAAVNGKMFMGVKGIYLSGGVLFIQLGITNNSGIPFRLDFIRCYQKDRRKSKRTSQMEKEVPPLATSYKEKPVIAEGTGQHTLVLAFDQFTIADNKYFMIEAFEQKGDRHMVIKLKGKDLLKAKALLSR